jgi:hypothetical protein
LLWLTPSACKNLDHCTDLKLGIIFNHKGHSVRLDIWMENNDTMQLLPLYLTYQYMQVTTRCHARSIYNKHFYL